MQFCFLLMEYMNRKKTKEDLIPDGKYPPSEVKRHHRKKEIIFIACYES